MTFRLFHSPQRILTLRLPLALIVLVLLALPASGADWKGTEEVVDGFRVIKNPAEAMNPPMTIELQESFRLGGWAGGDDEFFGTIADIIEDADGNLYVLDGQLNEIKIFDRQGNFVDTIGREGEGPGEWRRASNLLWMPNGDIGVVQFAPGRIIAITPSGEAGNDFALEPLANGGSRVLQGARVTGENLAVVYNLNKSDPDAGTFTQTTVLSLFDIEGTEFAKLLEVSGSLDFASPKISEIEFDNFSNRWNADTSGRVFALPVLARYSIDVWNPDGSPSRKIQREYPPHERTSEEREELLDLYRGLTTNSGLPPNTKCVVEDTHPCVGWGGINTRPDGSLWVITSRGNSNDDSGSLGVFDVYDPKGRFVRQAHLRGQCENKDDGIFFVGERVIVVTEFLSSLVNARGGGSLDEESGEEPEPMAIICYTSDQLDAAAGIPQLAKGSK